VAAEPLHRPDVAVGLVEGAGDRLVTEPVGSDRSGELGFAAELPNDQVERITVEPGELALGTGLVEPDEERTGRNGGKTVRRGESKAV
jgi:hypothetical protein